MKCRHGSTPCGNDVCVRGPCCFCDSFSCTVGAAPSCLAGCFRHSQRSFAFLTSNRQTQPWHLRSALPTVIKPSKHCSSCVPRESAVVYNGMGGIIKVWSGIYVSNCVLQWQSKCLFGGFVQLCVANFNGCQQKCNSVNIKCNYDKYGYKN